jgi:hypothetical protein
MDFSRIYALRGYSLLRLLDFRWIPKQLRLFIKTFLNFVEYLVPYLLISLSTLHTLTLINSNIFNRDAYISDELTTFPCDDYFAYLLTTLKIIFGADWVPVMQQSSLVYGPGVSIYFMLIVTWCKDILDNMLLAYFIFLYSDVYWQYSKQEATHIPLTFDRTIREKKEIVQGNSPGRRKGTLFRGVIGPTPSKKDVRGKRHSVRLTSLKNPKRKFSYGHGKLNNIVSISKAVKRMQMKNKAGGSNLSSYPQIEILLNSKSNLPSQDKETRSKSPNDNGPNGKVKRSVRRSMLPKRTIAESIAFEKYSNVESEKSISAVAPPLGKKQRQRPSFSKPSGQPPQPQGERKNTTKITIDSPQPKKRNSITKMPMEITYSNKFPSVRRGSAKKPSVIETFVTHLTHHPPPHPRDSKNIDGNSRLSIAKSAKKRHTSFYKSPFNANNNATQSSKKSQVPAQNAVVPMGFSFHNFKSVREISMPSEFELPKQPERDVSRHSSMVRYLPRLAIIPSTPDADPTSVSRVDQAEPNPGGTRNSESLKNPALAQNSLQIEKEESGVMAKTVVLKKNTTLLKRNNQVGPKLKSLPTPRYRQSLPDHKILVAVYTFYTTNFYTRLSIFFSIISIIAMAFSSRRASCDTSMSPALWFYISLLCHIFFGVELAITVGFIHP